MSLFQTNVFAVLPETMPCRCTRRHYDECRMCGGKKVIARPEMDVLDVLFKVSKKSGYQWKVSKPTGNAFRDLRVGRSYYLWRLARFYGGADVTMPMNADLAVHGDPYVDALTKIAKMLARTVFGTDRAATARWSGVLGSSAVASAIRAEPGLPATAFENGPVADGNKPIEECLEMR